MEIEVTRITAADNDAFKGTKATVTFIDYKTDSGSVDVFVNLPLDKNASISETEERAKKAAIDKLKEIVALF